MILYHYTCEHHAPKIESGGRLLGAAHPMLPQIGPIVWLTHMQDPEPLALGLPPTQPGCDRLAYRVTVELANPLRWASWARRNIPVAQRQAVENNCRGTLIAYWWLSLQPVPVLSINPTTDPVHWPHTPA